MALSELHVVDADDLVIDEIERQHDAQEDRTQRGCKAPIERNLHVVGNKVADQ